MCIRDRSRTTPSNNTAWKTWRESCWIYTWWQSVKQETVGKFGYIWKTLESYSLHAQSSWQHQKIWTFSDVVHIIKCVRIYFHDKGKVYYNNKLIDFKFYKQLFQIDTSWELGVMRVCNKLTSAHVGLHPSTFQCLNVRLAFQLFSRSIVHGIKFYQEIRLDGFEESKPTEDFTRALNSLADILNSSTPTTAL